MRGTLKISCHGRCVRRYIGSICERESPLVQRQLLFMDLISRARANADGKFASVSVARIRDLCHTCSYADTGVASLRDGGADLVLPELVAEGIIVDYFAVHDPVAGSCLCGGSVRMHVRSATQCQCCSRVGFAGTMTPWLAWMRRVRARHVFSIRGPRPIAS